MKKLIALAIIPLIFPGSTPLRAQGGSGDNCSTTNTNCACRHGRVEILLGGNSYEADYNGNMELACIETGTTPEGILWRKQRSTGFTVTGVQPLLGTITVYLDSNRTQPYTYLTSLTPGGMYPASHHVYAYARATISSIPGTLFRSTAPFHMYNNSVPSFGISGSNIDYTVDADIHFENEGDPGTTVFTVKATPTTVNP